MSAALFVPVGIFLASLSVLSLFLLLRARYKAERLRAHLRIARGETEDIAQILIHNPYPFIRLSADGQITFSNPAALWQFLGLAEEGIAHPALAGLEDFLNRPGKRPLTREIVIEEKSWHQTLIPVSSGGASSDSGGGLAVYCYDVSERKVFEKQLEESREVAESANRAKSDFLANMSHELRTPMNGIIGLSDILARMDLGEKPRELAGVVHSSARNLLALLNDILDFSKIEAGELTLERIAFDPRAIVTQIIRLQKAVADEKGLVLEALIDPEVPSFLEGDPARLQQILHNLVNNALKFTREGFVRIEASYLETDEQGQGELRLRIRDSGVGIAQDKQHSVFEKFTQADLSTARKYGGTGLGLSITKQLVTMMEGRIALESQEGKGTLFEITIPAPVAESAESKAMESVQQAPGGLNRQAGILIVDDHPINLLFLRNLLEDFGFTRIEEARSGQEALALCRSRPPFDLILMDCQMPDMDGYEAARRIVDDGTAQGRRTPPVIAVTADAMAGAREKCLEAGMADYISKPVERTQLVALLETWLSGMAEVTASNPVFLETRKTRKEKEPLMLDRARLAEFTGGDPEREREIFALFSENIEHDLEALRKALCEDDQEEWEKYTHKLYGSAANIGAQILAGLCDEAQEFLPENRAEKQAVFDQITTRYEELQRIFSESAPTTRHAQAGA
ncbi:MAG: response regulator [Alphaproteobacteria bacterium]|nr:response regulator [Alphaproteobacteria bacterium]